MRTSPPQAVLIRSMTPGPRLRGFSRREFMMSTARCTALAMSEGLTALNSKTVERLRMALKTQK